MSIVHSASGLNSNKLLALKIQDIGKNAKVIHKLRIYGHRGNKNHYIVFSAQTISWFQP